MNTKHELADSNWEKTERHSQMEYLERMAARFTPLTSGQARACENATGPECVCRCGGWLHGIYAMGMPPSLAVLEDVQQH